MKGGIYLAMPLYLYRAVDAQGKPSIGKLEVPDKAALIRELSGQGLFFVSCREESPLAPAPAKAAPSLPRKVVGPGMKAKAIELFRWTRVFLSSLQQWSKLGEATEVLRGAGFGPGHPLDRFTLAFTHGLEKIYHVRCPADQSMTDEFKKHLVRKRDRAVMVTIGLAVMGFIFLITRIPFYRVNPMRIPEALEARQISEGMTRREVEGELGHGYASPLRQQTIYAKSPGFGIAVTFDTTGGPGSPDNRVIGHGTSVAVWTKGSPAGAGAMAPNSAPNRVTPK